MVPWSTHRERKKHAAFRAAFPTRIDSRAEFDFSCGGSPTLQMTMSSTAASVTSAFRRENAGHDRIFQKALECFRSTQKGLQIMETDRGSMSRIAILDCCAPYAGCTRPAFYIEAPIRSFYHSKRGPAPNSRNPNFVDFLKLPYNPPSTHENRGVRDERPLRL